MTPPWGHHCCRWRQLDAWPFAILYSLWLIAALRMAVTGEWQNQDTIKLGLYGLVILHVSNPGQSCRPSLLLGRSGGWRGCVTKLQVQSAVRAEAVGGRGYLHRCCSTRCCRACAPRTAESETLPMLGRGSQPAAPRRSLLPPPTCSPAANELQILLELFTYWSVRVKCIVRFRPARSLQNTTHVRVHPHAFSGTKEVVPLLAKRVVSGAGASFRTPNSSAHSCRKLRDHSALWSLVGGWERGVSQGAALGL